MFGRSSSSDPSKSAEAAKAAGAPTPPAPGFMPASAAGAPAATAPPTLPSQPSGTAPQGGLAVSLIGRDLIISGDKINIVSGGRLQVDGEIIGDLTGREIVIGETGRVTGSIAADSIDVRGKVDGGIRGASISLRQSARVTGDILHQSLSIAEGAQFDGRVRRAKDGEEVKPDLTKTQAG